MSKAEELYRIDNAQIIRFTDLAVLVNIDGEEHWFPFSQITDPDELEIRASRGLTIEVVTFAWLAKKKGMTEFAKNLREAVAYTNRQLRGTEPAPWEVVMEALILVEERLTELRKEFEEFKAVQWPL